MSCQSTAETTSFSPKKKFTCKNVDLARDALGLAWNEEHGYTRPCGEASNTCGDVLATWISSFTSAANARFNATRAKIEFNNLSIFKIKDI